jgi:penicillin G amidase
MVASRSMRIALRLGLALVVAGLAAGFWVRSRVQRSLPRTDGTLRGTGIGARARIVRDRWGVPHIFAASDEDAAFALGFAAAQDRLFQMDLLRHLSQGRLCELFGPSMLKTDRLFRTMQLHRVAEAKLALARPEARRDVAAYARGVNAAVFAMHGRLPPEFSILGLEFVPAEADDFVGILGYMAWGLNMSWHFDPLYTKLAARVGPERAGELFPFDFGGAPAVYPGWLAPREPLALFELSPFENAFLATLPALRASNNWVLAPSRTTTGAPILANDPHLSHGVPGIWYEAHLKTPSLDVAGVTIPGLPAVVLGHNRDIAWGFTNVMLDGADFFVESLDPADPSRVRSGSGWARIEERTETIRVKGAAAQSLVIRTTPHGPLVTELLPGETHALSYQWNYFAAEGNEVDASYLLNRAGNWSEFRDAARHFGAVAQNVAYADRAGHIGMQTVGLIPRLKGRLDGSAFRNGADGSEDWDGFVPFEENPVSFDPPQGWLASANNPTLPRSPYYISSQWEPVDRYLRIREMIESRPRLSVDDVKRMQSDTVVPSARECAALVVAAFRDTPSDATLGAALDQLRGWDGGMRRDLAAPTLFAVFYRRLFYEIFEDEFGHDIAQGYRAQANVSALMIRQVLGAGPARWFDRIDTPGVVEDRDAIVREAFAATVRELTQRLGDDPASWRWERLHTITFRHALGRGSRLLGLFFDRGPFPVPGHSLSVNKMEFPERDFGVLYGPSMRQIHDLQDLERSLAVLPMGQSGHPGSPHYDDLLPLWLAGSYHPYLMNEAAIEKDAEAHLVLEP